MKALVFLALMALSFQVFSQGTEATCGEVRKASNGKILKRLEPNLFELNSKFVLKTKFYNYINLREDSRSDDLVYGDLTKERETAYTAFSMKDKFLAAKKDLKTALKRSNTVWACVGHISISFKYEGSHAYVSEISLEDAIAKFNKQYKRHAPKPLRITW